MRRARYPASFVLRHPLRVARNLVGNHPFRLADRYLIGLSGVEIGGAAHNDFFLRTLNVDLQRAPSTNDAQLTFAGRQMPIDVLAQADDLPFADDAYDFVLASHVLEHLPDPVGALKEWSRVARSFGSLGWGGWDRQWSWWSSVSFVEMCGLALLKVIEVQDPDDKTGNGFAVVLDASA